MKMSFPKQFPEEIQELTTRRSNMNSLAQNKKILALSDDIVYVKDDEGRPLLLAGTFCPSLLGGYRELWMMATNFLTIRHMRELRAKFRVWLAYQVVPIYARAQDPVSRRFIDFLGMQLVGTHGGVTTYVGGKV